MTAFSSSRSLRSHQPGVPRSSPGLALLLILALLLPAFHGPGQGQTSQSAPQRTLPDTPDAPPRAVPPTLAVRPEVIGLRTATSAVFDMGDNTYTLFQDSRPLHYQDEAGTWQAVNPAFAATQQGWNNLTNPLQTSLGLNTSAARISAANIGAAWRPLDLSLTAADGRRQTLATPLASWDAAAGVRSGDSRSVRYHASWSDADVQDQWQAGRGSSEYAMRLQSRPEVAGLAPEHLDLRVLLTLLPGTTVQVNGQPASLPLETAEALEFVGPDGVAMRLMPPRTLEQKNAAESVAGSYLLRSGGSATELELLVRTPWSWLNAQERQYPVIIDPLFQIRSPFEYKIARYPWNGVSEQSTAGPFENYVTMDRLAAGQFNEGALRLLLHYDMPTMPIGTRVQEAYLSATPSGAFNDRANQVTAMDAYVFDDWSHPPLEVATPGMPAPQAGPYETRMAYSETFAGAGQHISHVWDISSAAETWLQRTITQGAEAGGIIIRARDERRCFYLTGVIVHERQHCGGFYFASPSTWTEDDLFLTEVISDPGAAPADAPEGTGIRLEVRYQGPTLTKGQTIDMRPSFGVAGGSPSADPNYYHADHEYRVANANLRDNRWSALVARGFAATTANPLPAPDQVRFATPLNGALALSVRTGDDQQQRASSSADSGQVGYVLFDGRDGGGLDAAPRVRVRATTNATPANAYDVRLIGQTGALTGTIPGTIAGGTMQELNYTFASDQPLGLWNLRLPASSNSRVDIAVPADSLESSAYYHNARFFNAELYDSSAGTYLTPQSGHIRVASNVEPNSSPWSIAEGSVFLTSGIFPVAAAGDYGLALRYNGPAVTVNDIPEPPAFGAPQAPNENKQLAFSIKVRITSCQTVDILGYPLFPTSAGTCEAIKCPSTATPFRTGDGLGMWSPAGWTAPAAPFDNVAGSVLFGANSSSSAPTVAVVGGTVHYDGAKVTISGPTNTQPASVLLLQCPALTGANQAPTGYFSVFDGKLASVNPLIGTSSLQPSPAGSGTSHYDPWLTTDKVDLQSQGSRIVPATGLALGNAQVTRRTGAESTDNLYFNANWGVD
ncbi:MAG TPA: hypothetical protein VD886_04270, partial [Herpetosiphonaceae bacterium]|nr:hypothetical protein [Herpetosiphonaceae bacterium]